MKAHTKLTRARGSRQRRLPREALALGLDDSPRLAAAGSGPGTGTAGGAGGGGAIAGGTSTLLRVVATARAAGVPLAGAVRAASEAPARVLGLSGSRGSLAPGMAADLLVTAEDLTLRRVLRAGGWLE